MVDQDFVKRWGGDVDIVATRVKDGLGENVGVASKGRQGLNGSFAAEVDDSKARRRASSIGVGDHGVVVDDVGGH